MARLHELVLAGKGRYSSALLIAATWGSWLHIARCFEFSSEARNIFFNVKFSHF